MATIKLSAKARTLVERPVIANVATVDAAGHPQLTPVWIGLDGDDVVFNTARGRVKDRNLTRDPHVVVSVVDPDDPYNVLVVRGTVDATEDGADAHIDSLAKKYLGVDTYPMRKPGEVRVKYRCTPTPLSCRRRTAKSATSPAAGPGPAGRGSMLDVPCPWLPR